MGDLRALIEAVEAGEVRMSQCASAFPSESAGGLCTWHRVWAAYNGSLDAALALHNALLPGWFPGMSQNIHHGHWFAWVQNKASMHSTAQDNTPARAWLLAILRAKEAGHDRT